MHEMPMSIFAKTQRKPVPPDPDRASWDDIKRTPRPALTSCFEHACWAGLQCLADLADLARPSSALFRSGARQDAKHAVGYFFEAVSRVSSRHVRGALAEVRDLIHDRGREQQAQDHAEWRIAESSTAAELAEQLLAAIEGAETLTSKDVDEMREVLATRSRAERELEAEREKLLATDWSDPTPESIPQLAELRDRLLIQARLCYGTLSPAEQQVYNVLGELPPGYSLSKASIEEKVSYLEGSHLEEKLTELRKRGIVEPVGQGRGTEWRLKDRLPDEPK